MHKGRYLNAVVAVAVMLYTSAAHALINPRFTPVQLVKQSVLIASVDVKQGESEAQYTMTVREVIKGKTDKKSFRLDLTKARDAQSADYLRTIAAEGKPALLFAGEFESGAGTGGAPAQSVGLLHISGNWASCVGAPDGVWLFDTVDPQYQAVWAGGADMLRRAVDYILEDDDPVVPVTDGVSWSTGPVKLATLDGAITAVRPINLTGDGRLALYVARDKGDRLLTCDATTRKATDVTTACGLQSKSQAFAWGDFAGQKRLDLMSFDGQALSLHAQQADGTFKTQAFDAPGATANGCVSLTALDGGVKGRASLLVSTTNSLPVLVSLDADGKPSVSVLTAAAGIESAPQKLGKAGACLVADFDGDAIADILAPHEAASMLFGGLAPGKFAPGVACAVKLGKRPSGACMGDFDSDGRLDIFCVNSDGVSVWQNNGNGKFTDEFALCGELTLHSQRGGSDCMIGDVNNDGRQDVLIAYGPSASKMSSPHLFFNRGYRSFGHAHTLDLSERHLLLAANDAKDGQQTACLGDFDGDGAQDMTLALRNGEIWLFFRENGDREARMAVGFLPTGASYKGPITVTGWIGKRCLGAWNVLPGVSQAYFGRWDAGAVTLKWRLPGGKEQSREVVLEKGGTLGVEIR